MEGFEGRLGSLECAWGDVAVKRVASAAERGIVVVGGLGVVLVVGGVWWFRWVIGDDEVEIFGVVSGAGRAALRFYWKFLLEQSSCDLKMLF